MKYHCEYCNLGFNKYYYLNKHLKAHHIGYECPNEFPIESLTCYNISSHLKTRLGKNGDGGYVILDINEIKYDVLIGCGIKDDDSFEHHFLNKHDGIKCFAFDRIDKLPNPNDRITFVKKYIGPNNTNDVTNLHDIIDTHESIFLQSPFEQNKWQNLQKLCKSHYLVHIHANNSCGIHKFNNTITIPNVFECTYINKKHVVNERDVKLNTNNFPIPLDQKNNKRMPAITLSGYPYSLS